MNESQLIKDISKGVEYIGERTYRNFLFSFNCSENDFGDLTKLEASICALFLFDYMIMGKQVSSNFREQFITQCFNDLFDEFSNKLNGIELNDLIRDKYATYANIPVKAGKNWQQSLHTNLEFNLKATKGNMSFEEPDPLEIIRGGACDPMSEMRFRQEEVKNSYLTAKMVEELLNGKNFSETISILKKLENKPTGVKMNPKKEGCYIATMVYGDYNAREVLTLRHYRDTVLLPTVMGRFMIQCYYLTSPIAVRLLKNQKKINIFIKKFIDKIVKTLDNNGK